MDKRTPIEVQPGEFLFTHLGQEKGKRTHGSAALDRKKKIGTIWETNLEKF
jgi:hypothetical protein